MRFDSRRAKHAAIPSGGVAHVRCGLYIDTMPPISVMICCANSQDTLPAVCESVRACAWVDELVIVDSGSTDETETIARNFADKYVQEPWRGYSAQKAFGTTLCKNDWVFVLDSDEEISPQLNEQIAAFKAEQFEKCDVIHIRRRNWIMGRPVRSWFPDWQSRLIHRHRVKWTDDALHEDRLPSSPERVAYLSGWIEHKRGGKGSFDDYFGGKRMDDRLLMVARQMYQRGKRCKTTDLIFRPWAAFFKAYIIKRGFLDGTFGLLIAQKNAVSTQLKYAALWYVQNVEMKP